MKILVCVHDSEQNQIVLQRIPKLTFDREFVLSYEIYAAKHKK